MVSIIVLMLVSFPNHYNNRCNYYGKILRESKNNEYYQRETVSSKSHFG